jgi:hypothetical protein
VTLLILDWISVVALGSGLDFGNSQAQELDFGYSQ